MNYLRNVRDWEPYFADIEDDAPRGKKQPAKRTLVAMTGDDVEQQETTSQTTEMVIEGLLPARGFCPMVGESNIGKSPLLMQAAACVATGKPFLGMATKQGRVMIVDHENQGRLIKTLRAVSHAIGVDYVNDVKPHLTFLERATADETFEWLDANSKEKFALIVVDALRGFAQGREKESDVMQPMITRMDGESCWLVCHHPRKGDRKNPPPSLEDDDTRVTEWMEEASGSKAITNQASTRIAVIVPKKGDAALFIRASVKGVGDVGPFIVERITDDETPLGYKVAGDWRLLGDTHKQLFASVSGQSLSFAALKEKTGVIGGKLQSFLEATKRLNLYTVTGRERTPERRYNFKTIEYRITHAETSATGNVTGNVF